MDGHLLDQPLPQEDLEMVDPFLLIHHWNNALIGGAHQREVGVGPHPHRGFSPITMVIKGSVHHRDSRGNNSIVSEGGVQWMHAGMGLHHSERPEQRLAKEGGPFEIIQFWLNSPASHKMIQPSYQAIQKAEIPEYVTADGLTVVAVICGRQFGLQGPAKHFWPTVMLKLEFQSGGKIDLDIPMEHNAILYNLDGNLKINGEQRCFMKDMAVFDHGTGSHLHLESTGNTRAIVLASKPIGEPVAKYGPFVMNTQTEIMEALRDSRMGKMGVLIEEF